MPGDAVAEVLDVERTLESRSEETAKGRNKGREAGKDEEVELVRRIRDCGAADQLQWKKHNVSGISEELTGHDLQRERGTREAAEAYPSHAR